MLEPWCQREAITPEFAESADALMAAYYELTQAKVGIPPYAFKWDRYQWMQENGSLLCTTIRLADALLGFTLYIIDNHPHHEAFRLADCDTFATDIRVRGTGLGKQLYAFTEEALREEGVQYITNRRL